MTANWSHVVSAGVRKAEEEVRLTDMPDPDSCVHRVACKSCERAAIVEQVQSTIYTTLALVVAEREDLLCSLSRILVKDIATALGVDSPVVVPQSSAGATEDARRTS
jgi:hypothetical protein